MFDRNKWIHYILCAVFFLILFGCGRSEKNYFKNKTQGKWSNNVLPVSYFDKWGVISSFDLALLKACENAMKKKYTYFSLKFTGGYIPGSPSSINLLSVNLSGSSSGVGVGLGQMHDHGLVGGSSGRYSMDMQIFAHNVALIGNEYNVAVVQKGIKDFYKMDTNKELVRPIFDESKMGKFSVIKFADDDTALVRYAPDVSKQSTVESFAFAFQYMMEWLVQNQYETFQVLDASKDPMKILNNLTVKERWLEKNDRRKMDKCHFLYFRISLNKSKSSDLEMFQVKNCSEKARKIYDLFKDMIDQKNAEDLRLKQERIEKEKEMEKDKMRQQRVVK